MSEPTSIIAEAFEILVLRELRKAGIEPLHMRRQLVASRESGFAFELVGKLECYGHRWSALIECRNRAQPVTAEDVLAVRRRADAERVVSALLCTTTSFAADAIAQARQLRVPLLRVVDAQQALMKEGLIQAGQLPAWVPEFTLQIVTIANAARLLEANQPELILRELRAGS